MDISVFVGKKSKNRNRNQSSKQNVQVSTERLIVVLDHSFVHDYLRSHEKAKETESVVISDDTDTDDSIEYIGTKEASPTTKKLAKINARIFTLEKENRRLLTKLTEKKTINAADDDVVPIEPNDAQASTSKSTSGYEADLELSLDDDMIGKMLDECKENGNLIDLAKDVVNFCMAQEQQQ